MTKFILLSSIIVLTFQLNAQKVFKQQIIIFPSKTALITINNKNKKLHNPFVCNENSEIKIIEGKVNVLTQDGDEFQLDSGKTISVHINNATENKSTLLNKVAKYIDKPSVFLPNLYSSKRADNFVFPLESKVVNKNTLKFYYSGELVEGAVFKIYHKKTNSLIKEQSVKTNEIIINKVALANGEEYIWKLYNGSNSFKGTFYMLTKAEKQKLKLTKLKKKTDYMEAFFTYLENQCLFDAALVITLANKKFPKSKAVISLLENLPTN